MSWILWSTGYLLCRDSQRRGTDLSTDVHRYLPQGGLAKLYDRKTPITAADLLNDRVLSFFEEHEIALSRMLTDRGRSTVGATAMNMSCTWR